MQPDLSFAKQAYRFDFELRSPTSANKKRCVHLGGDIRIASWPQTVQASRWHPDQLAPRWLALLLGTFGISPSWPVSATIVFFIDLWAEEICEKWRTSQQKTYFYRLMGRGILQKMKDVSANIVLSVYAISAHSGPLATPKLRKNKSPQTIQASWWRPGQLPPGWLVRLCGSLWISPSWPGRLSQNISEFVIDLCAEEVCENGGRLN